MVLSLLLACTQQAPEPEIAAKEPMAEVRFSVRFAEGRSTFQLGERIAVELVFATDTPDTWQLDASPYARHEPWHNDQFTVRPDTGVDPLADWFGFVFLGNTGGKRRRPVLGPLPEVVTRELNEYVWLEPGAYELTAATDRVASNDGPLPLEAGPLPFTVVPARPEWAAEALAAAVRAFDTSGDAEVRRAAARDLRFLGTPEAADAMATRLGLADPGASELELMFGLTGTSHRDRVIAALRAALGHAERPITYGFLQTLALLESKRAHPGPVPPYPDADAERRAWQSARSAERAERFRIERALSEVLAAAIPTKRREAAAVSTATLAAMAWAEDEPSLVEPGALVSRFGDLPAAKQLELLASEWHAVADPALSPILQALVDADATSEDLRARALQRLIELDLAEGRPRALAELQRPRSRLGRLASQVLGSLPDATLPDLDDALVAALARDPDHLDYEMVQRYATTAVADDVWALVEPRVDELGFRAFGSMVAYFLRVDRPRGVELLRAGTATPRGRLAHRGDLFLIGWYFQPDPALEEVCIALLDDPEPRVAAAAAQALGAHGTAAAADALWARLSAFHDTWSDRAGDLDIPRVGPRPHAGQVGLETALWQAIALGAGWYSAPADIDRLAALVVSSSGKGQVGVARHADEPELLVELALSGGFSGRVGQYSPDSLDALKAKVAQFPEGTRFRWSLSARGREDEGAAARAALQAVLDAHGQEWAEAR